MVYGSPFCLLVFHEVLGGLLILSMFTIKIDFVCPFLKTSLFFVFIFKGSVRMVERLLKTFSRQIFGIGKCFFVMSNTEI